MRKLAWTALWWVIGVAMVSHDWYADCVGVAAGVALAYLGLGAWAVTLERSVGLGRAARPRLK